MALADLPWSQFQVLGTQSSAVFGYSVQVPLRITPSPCCYGNIKKNFLIKSEGTHSGKYPEVSQMKAFLLQAVQDMTQGTRLNKQGQIKGTWFTWTRKHCC